MKRIRKASSLLLSLAIASHVAALCSQAGPPDEPKAPTVPQFTITPNRNARGGVREIQAFAAELIGRQAEKDRSIPDGRARHFSWIMLPIVGWNGTILDLSTLPSGLHVRVRVSPRVGGAWCAIGGYTDETYLISNGVARLTTIAYSDSKRPRVLIHN